MKSSAGDSKRRLVSFTENVRRKNHVAEKIVAPQRKECSLNDGDIVGLEVVASLSGRPMTIAVSYISGQTMFVSPDLQRADNLQQPDLDGSADYEVEHAAIMDVETAKKGVLRSREDVVGLLDSAASNDMLLCHIVRATNGQRHFRLYKVKLPDQRLQTVKSAASLILDVSLPGPPKQSTKHAQYELHSESGTLYQLLSGGLRTFDLTGTSPTLVATFGSHAYKVFSFIRISSTLAMTASHNKVSLYETDYGSLYGSMSFSAFTGGDASSRKRKREEGAEREENTVSLEQLCSLSEAGPIVGLKGHDLVVVQLSEALKINKGARSKGTRLVDVVSGNAVQSSHQDKMRGSKRKKWTEWTALVDRLIESDDIEGLENLVANDPEMGLQRSGKPASQKESRIQLTNGDKQAYEELWPLPETFEPASLDQQRCLYVLSKVFGPCESGIDIRILSLKLLEWLALAGFLSAKHIRSAWNETGSVDSLAETNTAQPGSIFSAIQPFDEDFQLADDLLSLPVHWEIEEIVEALRSIMQSFDEIADVEDAPLALPPVPQQTGGDVPMINGDVVKDNAINGDAVHGDMTNGDADSHLEFESKAAEQELDHAVAALSTGLEVRSSVLQAIFSRLLAFDQRTITSRLRDMMSHRELIFFIQILRVELADGGWTSRYIGTGEDEHQEEPQGMVNAMEGAEEGGPSNEALRTIGDLLNCAVDAIGTSGWLVGLSSNTVSAQELLASLRAEVSAGLEGCYEADTLGTTLGEIERFAAQTMEQQQPGSGKFELVDVDTEDVETLLPMGGRAYPAVVDGKGKGAIKSKIALAQEQRRKVGKYSFDRIRI